MKKDAYLSFWNDDEDDNSEDIEFPSDLSEDSHPLVENEEGYAIVEIASTSTTTTSTKSTATPTRVAPIAVETSSIPATSSVVWMIKDINVIDELLAFRLISKKLDPKGLSDLHLL